MFTGIIENLAEILENFKKGTQGFLSLKVPENFLPGLQQGASVAVNGVCLTVVEIKNQTLTFDLLEETLQKTTLGDLKPGQKAHVERSLRYGDEVGGHLVTGHVQDTASLVKNEGEKWIFKVKSPWIKYFFPKGSISIDGVSLTIVDVDPSSSCFSVHLIPETLKKTLLSKLTLNSRVNIEIEQQVISIVDTLEKTKKAL